MNIITPAELVGLTKLQAADLISNRIFENKLLLGQLCNIPDRFDEIFDSGEENHYALEKIRLLEIIAPSNTKLNRFEPDKIMDEREASSAVLRLES